MNAMGRFQITGPSRGLAKGEKVILTAFLSNPEVIADMGGREFDGFHQFTGSCVGVSMGNSIAVISAVQRTLADSPTKAFLPWWPYPYGRTRFSEGDRGPGEGAVDSVAFQTLINEGCFAVSEAAGVPIYSNEDGFCLPSKVELQYSDGAASVNTKFLALGKQHPLGTAALVSDTAGILNGVVNGYPILDGCDNYIGNGSIQSGVALGTYDGRGGHSTGYVGAWNHPDLGMLFLYWNQWAGDTYPDDGSGKPRCSVWVKESNVAKLFSTGGRGETAALSHLTYFPAQPKVLDWMDIWPKK